MVKVGVLGAGFMGAMHAEAYANLTSAQLVGVADLRAEKAEELASKHGVKAYTAIEALLGEKEIEAVDVCLPTFLHKKYVLAAAQAGKHMICEKPIAPTLKDADAMIKAVAKAQVKLMVAHVIRFWPEYMKLKEIYDGKQLGNLLSINCIRLSPTPTWGWENWLLDPERSGGAVVDLHIHDADYLLYLLGKPRSVISRGRKTSHGWDHVVTSYDYPSGVAAFAEGRWDLPQSFPFTMAFTALFEKGAVEFNVRNEKPLAIYRDEGEPEYPQVGEVREAAPGTEGNIAQLGGYFNEIEYFISCLDKGQAFKVVTAQDARTALEIVLAERKSLETGKEVTL